MSEIVTKVEAALRPAPGTSYTDMTLRGSTFEISVANAQVTAVPLPGVVIDPDSAGTILEREVAPFLAVLSAELQRPVELVAPVPSFVDSRDPSRAEKHRPVSVGLAVAFIVEGPTFKSDFATRVAWAQTDPVYRDLCDLLAASEASPNPRPEAFKMIERLEQKFDGRGNAKTTLGLVDADIRIIVAGQSQFRGDRHAEYAMEGEPSRLDAQTRHAVIDAARLLRRRYEEKVLGASLVS